MRAKLGDIFEISSGGTPSKSHPEYYGGDIPWVKTGDLKKEYLYEVEDFITEEGLKNSSAKMYESDTVLIAMYGATIGATSILKMNACTNQACAAFKKNEQVIPEYLYYFLRSQKDKFVKDGVGGAQPNISARYLKKVEMELPSIDEQRIIVNILDKISNIIVNRNQEMISLDDLIKARFVELFGDVKINQHNYKKVKIKQVLKSCEAGWSGNGTQRVKKDDEIAVLKVSAVTKGYFIPEECKVLDDQENIKKYVTPEKGDLLFSRANTREMVGATAIVREDYPTLILPDKLWKIRFNDSANVFYMKYVLSSKSIRNEFSASSTGTSGSMFNVSMDKFKEIEIPIAPIELQNQFADFVQAIDKSKLQYHPHTHTCQPNTS